MGLKVNAYDNTGQFLCFGHPLPSAIATDPHGVPHVVEEVDLYIPHGCTALQLLIYSTWSFPTSELDGWGGDYYIKLGDVTIASGGATGTGIDNNGGSRTSQTDEYPVPPSWWGTTRTLRLEVTASGTPVGQGSFYAEIQQITCILSILT